MASKTTASDSKTTVPAKKDIVVPAPPKLSEEVQRVLDEDDDEFEEFQQEGKQEKIHTQTY